jgi:hypothetical protein
MLENVQFFSDGAASQFKQKFLFVILTFFRDEYMLKSLIWHFFATSHGKGAVDGIDDTIKRLVWTRILAGRAIVNGALTFAQCAKAASVGIEGWPVNIWTVKI